MTETFVLDNPIGTNKHLNFSQTLISLNAIKTSRIAKATDAKDVVQIIRECY